MACVEASCAGIGRPVNLPVFKSWNGRIQPGKISWCDGPRPFPSQAKNTKPGREYRVGWGRSRSVRPPHNVSRESDNNIVPEKQANNGNIVAPAESVEGRALTERNIMEGATVRTQCRLAVSFGLHGVRRRAVIETPPASETRGRSRMR